MKRRPSLLDRAMFVAARSHTQRIYNRFVRATRDAARVQQDVLLAKIRRNAESSFGRDHHFERIRSVDDFVRYVPVGSYEDHRPYIDRVKNGELTAMFGHRQRVHMFALTSGTTDEPKYIPVTDAFLGEYRLGWNAFGIKALLDHPAGFLRGIVQITSRMDESFTPGGIPCGAISGLIASVQKRLVHRYYVTPRCIAEIDDAEAKYYTIMRLAVPADVAFPITANPATQLKLARTANAQRDELIRDIHDGTLRPDLPVSPHVRQQLKRRLVPDPAAARRLEALVSEHGELLPKHYWDLAFIANWTGGTMGLYLRDFPHFFGQAPVRDIGLVASEGRVSIPIEDRTPAGVLDIVSHFFEFVPRDRVEEVEPTSFPCHELEIGQEYFVLMTTSSGLYRYRLGDLVRVVDYVGQAPVIEFLNKGEHVCSLAGEKLTEHQVILAMERAAAVTNDPIVNFVLAPQWADVPYYRLHVEPERGDDPTVANELAGEFDKALSAVNVEYASKRHTNRLGAVALNVLPGGFLTQLDHKEAEARRKGNEQYKHRYLYPRPGMDKSFPVQTSPFLMRQAP